MVLRGYARGVRNALALLGMNNVSFQCKHVGFYGPGRLVSLCKGWRPFVRLIASSGSEITNCEVCNRLVADFLPSFQRTFSELQWEAAKIKKELYDDNAGSVKAEAADDGDGDGDGLIDVVVEAKCMEGFVRHRQQVNPTVEEPRYVCGRTTTLLTKCKSVFPRI